MAPDKSGIQISIFLISPRKHVGTYWECIGASNEYHNISFHGKIIIIIKKISVLFGGKRVTYVKFCSGQESDIKYKTVLGVSWDEYKVSRRVLLEKDRGHICAWKVHTHTNAFKLYHPGPI